MEARRPDRLGVDLVLGPAHVGWELAEQLDRLAPFGKGHPEPILAVTGLLLADARRFGPDGQHLRLRLLRGYESLDAVAFGVGADRAVPPDGSWIDVVGTLERDGWEGEPRLRLRVLDFADHEASPIAARRRDARQRVAVNVG
jgi:single-stranded-DNA-specific exonuclease